MLLYFEFEEKRRKAEVTWPKNDENIIVHITDPELVSELPSDLYYEVQEGNRVSFTVESPDDVRLLELQNVIKRRLQEFVTKS